MDAARLGKCRVRADINSAAAVLYPAYGCRASLCVALMISAEEGLISAKDSKSKVLFRLSSPRSDRGCHHEYATCSFRLAVPPLLRFKLLPKPSLLIDPSPCQMHDHGP